MYKITIFLLLLILASCGQRATGDKEPTMLSIQLVDRHGFSETISARERLSQYQNVDFLTPQPYQKILRIYGRDSLGKTRSKITSYHSNGQISHFLEIVDGRAHGVYREWHENGHLKLETQVIEGVADISPIAQSSWLFTGTSHVWDDQGHLIAEIPYEKGKLEGPSKYYHVSGTLEKVVPYIQDVTHGVCFHYNESTEVLEQIPFEKGLKQGTALGFWEKDSVKYQETYEKDLLIHGSYFLNNGEKIAGVQAGEGKQALFDEDHLYSLVEIRQGEPVGLIQIFNETGDLVREYSVKEQKKHGEEIEYYPLSKTAGKLVAKLLVTWREDALNGAVKTWYDNGTMESQRELVSNKKQGMSFAWYKDGSLMLSEEYENDKIIKGSYFKKGEKIPVSKIEGGKGLATLFDGDGHFVKKVTYEGKPLIGD